jgi:hypothetical protein
MRRKKHLEKLGYTIPSHLEEIEPVLGRTDMILGTLEARKICLAQAPTISLTWWARQDCPHQLLLTRPNSALLRHKIGLKLPLRCSSRLHLITTNPRPRSELMLVRSKPKSPEPSSARTRSTFSISSTTWKRQRPNLDPDSTSVTLSFTPSELPVFIYSWSDIYKLYLN